MAENKIWRWYRRHKEAVGLMLEFARGVVPGVGLVIGGLQVVLARMNDDKAERDEVKEAEMERLLEEIKPIVNEVMEEIEEKEEFRDLHGLREEDMLKRGQEILLQDEEIREELEKIMPQLSQSLVMSVGRLERKPTTKIIGGKYELMGKIGRGGQGEVWKARHLLAEKMIALKFLPEELSEDENGIGAVRQEYGRVTNLVHPSIVQYREFDYDEESKRYFLVMDYVEGETLRGELMRGRDEPLPFKEAWKKLEAIGEALAFAHEQKIVHCDLKPENILVRKSDGKWLLTDFGLAKEIRNSLSLRSMKIDISGTMPYMSPEQYKGRRATPETDIWALGVILYEMVAGYHPFYGTSFEHYMKLVCEEEVERPENLRDEEWCALEKMLAKEKQERPSSFNKAWSDRETKETWETAKTTNNETAKLAEEMRRIQEENQKLEAQIAREKEAAEQKKKAEQEKRTLEQEIEKAKQEQERLAAEKRKIEEIEKQNKNKVASKIKQTSDKGNYQQFENETAKLAGEIQEENLKLEAQRQKKGYGKTFVAVIAIIFIFLILIGFGRKGNYQQFENGIIYDNKQKLEWFIGPDKDINWTDAASWVENLNHQQLGDGWRLPDIEELRSLNNSEMKNFHPIFKNEYLWVWSGTLCEKGEKNKDYIEGAKEKFMYFGKNFDFAQTETHLPYARFFLFRLGNGYWGNRSLVLSYRVFGVRSGRRR